MMTPSIYQPINGDISLFHTNDEDVFNSLTNERDIPYSYTTAKAFHSSTNYGHVANAHTTYDTFNSSTNQVNIRKSLTTDDSFNVSTIMVMSLSLAPFIVTTSIHLPIILILLILTQLMMKTSIHQQPLIRTQLMQTSIRPSMRLISLIFTQLMTKPSVYSRKW